MLVTAPALSELVSELGPNWRIKFHDADGFPLTMLSFQEIDFGAISYKEIFQNVKTILTTPLFSAALERTLGIDQSIVDLPINRAAEATVAIIDALYFWEPRCEIMNIEFEPDTLNGKLAVNLSLRIKNVIFGTDTPYDRIAISTVPVGSYSPTLKTWDEVTPQEKVIIKTVPVAGTPGPAGKRGSLWFTGDGPPSSSVVVNPFDMYLDNLSGDVYQYDGSSWRKKG